MIQNGETINLRSFLNQENWKQLLQEERTSILDLFCIAHNCQNDGAKAILLNKVSDTYSFQLALSQRNPQEERSNFDFYEHLQDYSCIINDRGQNLFH